MRSIFNTIFIIFFLFTLNTYGQDKHLKTKDSINIFYDKLFEELELNYLYSKNVDWVGIKPFIKEEALKSKSFQESLEQSVILFDTIKGNHTLLFTEKKMYKSTLGKELTGEQFNQCLADAYMSGKPFETKVIDNKYGYVLIPGMLLLNATRKELDEASQGIYNAIIKIDQSHNIKGWIIDLRLNVGGNANVMLAGLYHLLGNGTIYLTLDANKNVSQLYSMDNGIFYQNHKIITAVKFDIKPKPTIPIALISGILTASAGEDVVLGFRGRKNTIVIGEESYGLTTFNDLHELPFNTKVAITESYGTDRSAKFTESIVPDIEIIKETNFENLSRDKNVIEAIKFINSKY